MALLFLLQQREQVTAAEVARELEVSERTARRDLDALAMAGVPVYSMQGRGGGWRLVGGARTDLSGLTASEARALFLVAGPASAATPAVKAALRKLVRALPEPFRVQAEAAASSLVMDPQRWGSSRVEPRPPRFLDELQDAVIRGVQVRLGYVDRDRRRDRADRPPAGHRRQRSGVVPRRHHRGRPADLPDRPRDVRRPDRRPRRPPRRLLPRRELARDRRRGRPQANTPRDPGGVRARRDRPSSGSRSVRGSRWEAPRPTAASRS